MSKHVTELLEQGKARIVDAPEAKAHAPRHQIEVDRNFELPIALYATTVGLFFAFLGIMWAGLTSPGLIIPMAIFTVFILGMFGVPAIWTRLAPENRSQPMSWGKFQQNGIMTYTGRLSARDATVQVLILPALIVLWGMTVVTIVALVS